MKKGWWTLACVALLLTGMALTYRPWIADARITRLSGPLDSWAYFGGSALFLDTSLRQGEFPMWNPLVLCGTPYAANPQSKVFYPPQLMRSVWNTPLTPASTHQSLRLYGLAHALLAGLGTFLLARRHGLSPAAALVSAYALVFSGHCVLRVIAYHFLDVFAWLPLGLLFLNLALSASTLRTAAMYTVAAGLIGALGQLAGYPQVYIYCVFTAIVYAVGGTLLGVFQTPEATMPDRAVKRVAAVLGAAGGVALLGSMALILPAFEFYGLAARRGSETLAAQADSGKPTVRGMAEILLLFRGTGPFRPGLSCLSVVLLALAAWMHPNRRVTMVLFIMTLAGIDLALGPPFPIASLANWVSPFELPAPRRALIVATLPIALAAGLGVDALIRAHGEREARMSRWVIAGTIGGMLIAAAYAIDYWPKSPWNPLANRGDLRATAFLVPVVTVLIACGAHRLRPALVKGALLAAVILELALWNFSYVPLLSGESSAVPMSLLHTSPSGISRENVRVVHDSPNLNMYGLEPGMVGYEPGAVRDAWKVLSPPDAPDFTRYLTTATITRDSALGNLLVKRPFWLVNAWTRDSMPPKDRVFPPTYVVYLENAGPIDVAERDQTEIPNTAIAEARSAVPILEWTRDAKSGEVHGQLPDRSAHSALRVRYEAGNGGELETRFQESNGSTRFGWSRPLVAGSDEQTVEIALPDSIRPEFTLIPHGEPRGLLPRIAGIELVSDGADENDRIRIREWRANSVEIDVDAPAPRLLVFTDAYYPGWRGFVDGAEVEMYRADGAFKAVMVPTGTHEVQFRFRSPAVRIGAGISILTWILCLAGLCRLAIAERRARRAAHSGG